MRIAPSILSADFANLARDVHEVEQSAIDLIHIDVMDGHFVPNITMGANVVKALRPITDAELDVHLMVEEPDHLLPAFIEAGSNIITVHAEACTHLHRTIQTIKEAGVKAGVALNPATPVGLLKPVLADLDVLLIMTVNPGFGGQHFIHSMLDKISEANDLITFRKLPAKIEVDGGINAETLPLCKKAGAEMFVAGSSIFGVPDRRLAIDALRQSTAEPES